MATLSSNPTKLHIEVCNRNDDITVVKSLLASAGCQVNTQDHNGITALMHATQFGNVNIMGYLLQHGADVCIVDKMGRNALHYAIAYRCLKAVELLLEQKLAVKENLINAKTVHGETALIMASEINFIQATQLLVQHQAYLNAATVEGYTALHFAAEKKFANIVAQLIKHKACLDIPNCKGATPLVLATQKNNIYIVGLLVDAHANVNMPDEDGNAPAHIAAKYGYLEIMTCLVKQGHCDITLENKAEQTPLDLGELHEQTSVQELLMLGISYSKGRVKSKRLVKDKKELKYNTMKHLRNASTYSIKATITESYSKLWEIEQTISQRRVKQRTPLRSVSQVESPEPSHIEADGIQSTKNLLRGEKHTTTSLKSRTTLGVVNQSQPDSEAIDSGNTAVHEEDMSLLRQKTTLEKEVKSAETELKTIMSDTDISCPKSDCPGHSSWLDIFRYPSHQTLQKLQEGMYSLHMKIELLQSTVRTLCQGQICGFSKDICGDLTDKVLYKVANQLGKDWMKLGIELEVPHISMECMEHNNNKDIEAAARTMLISWRNSSPLAAGMKKTKLTKALQNIGRHDVADNLESWIR